MHFRENCEYHFLQHLKWGTLLILGQILSLDACVGYPLTSVAIVCLSTKAEIIPKFCTSPKVQGDSVKGVVTCSDKAVTDFQEQQTPTETYMCIIFK